MFATSVQSGFNTSVGNSKPAMGFKPDHARSQNPYYKQRRDSMHEESRIEPLETPSLVTSQTIAKLEDVKDDETEQMVN